METNTLAKDWAAMVKEKKNKRAAKALGVNEEDGAVVQDVMAFGMLAGLKKD